MGEVIFKGVIQKLNAIGGTKTWLGVGVMQFLN